MNPETENKIAESPSQKKELNQIGVGGIRSLRTLEGDIAEALKNQNINVTKINIAENARAEEQKNQIETPANQPNISKQAMLVRPIKAPEVVKNNIDVKSTAKNSALFFFTLIFIGAGFYGLYYFYKKSPLPFIEGNVPVQTNNYRSLIFSDSREDLFFTSLIGINIRDILKEKKESPISKEESVVEVLIGKGNEDDKTVISGEEFISITTENAPESVSRSLRNRFMYGFYEKDATRKPFLVMTTDLFQNLFSGTLKWEPAMRADFSSWFMDDVAVANSFIDKIYKNRDLRVLNDNNGNIVLLYTFLDKDTLIMTTGLDTLDEIIDRYEKQTYTR